MIAVFEFVLKNFAAPILFYAVFHLYGIKPAIGSAIAVTLVQFLYHWVRSLPVSPFMIIASSFTIGFGLIDLLLESPTFFKFEPFIHNVIIGWVFLATLWTERPLVATLIEALPRRWRPDSGPGLDRYLRNLTLAWAGYHFAKALIFLWLAFQVDLADLVVWRTLIGNVTIAMMVGGEILYRKKTWRKRPT
jgi:uncharacterized membrane protein